MENPAFNLVRQILRSPLFLSQSLNEQQATIDQIIQTGEITRDEVFRLINEAMEVPTSENSTQLSKNIESFDYNTFINFIMKGKIRGKDLISLCNTSRKLNNYCNQGFQLMNGQGIPYGPFQSQYLFRLLLDRMRIVVPINKTPRQTYIDMTIGGQVWGFGSNGNGELGLGDKNVRYSPTPIPSLKNIIQTSAGWTQSIYLDSQGRVWIGGRNDIGQLGLGDSINRNIKFPRLIPVLNNIIQVSSEYSYSLCLDDRGRVWSFGLNDLGQLGLGDNLNKHVPTLIPNFNSIVQVSAGHQHALCLDNQGRVWGFGNNFTGKLGLGDNLDRNVPTMIPNLINITQVVAGYDHSLCLDNQGRVWSFGQNDFGQLGLGDTLQRTVPTLIPGLDNIIHASANSQSLCLDDQGRVWSFGYNGAGQSGLGDTIDRKVPTLIPNFNGIVQVSAGGVHSLCLDDQGRVWGFGSGTTGQLGLPDVGQSNIPILNPYLTNIIQISAGTYHSLCIKGL